MWGIKFAGLASVVCASWFSNSPSEPLSGSASEPQRDTFSVWKSEMDGANAADGTDCVWWSGMSRYDMSAQCTPFVVTRIGTNVADKAMRRAAQCAAAAATDCVLSGEIGFNIPAAFVYDAEAGMKMIVAPRILEPPLESDIKTVRLQDPMGEHPNQLFSFNDTVVVEFLRGGTRVMETEVFRANDAYCVQLLRRAVVAECWDAID